MKITGPILRNTELVNLRTVYARMTRMLELHTPWIIMIYVSSTRYAGITYSYNYIILPSSTKYIYFHLHTFIYLHV